LAIAREKASKIMKLVTIDRPPDGRVGALIGDEVLDLGMAYDVFPVARWVPPAILDVLAAGKDGLDLIRRLIARVENASDLVKDSLREKGALSPIKGTRLKAPIQHPGILFSHGRAYHSHLAEMAKGGPVNIPEQPGGFLKNSNAIIGPGAPIVLPSQAADMVDFEAEISIVFSRPCHRVSKGNAMDYVLGFTILNDVSARNWGPTIVTKGNDINRMGKQFATFAPLGPCIATCDEFADPQSHHVVTRLNGRVMQDAWTKDLIWTIPELIEYYSYWYPFRAGDIMTTGTPAGVGYGREPKVFMKPGDIIAITVDGIGELSNPVIMDTVLAASN